MPKKIMWSSSRPVRPDVDPMLLALRQSLLMDNRSFYMKANASGLSPSTIKKIEDGTTRRPQALTIQMAYRMMGYVLKPVKMK